MSLYEQATLTCPSRMNFVKRNKRIRELRKTMKLADLAEKFNVSPERIRQIVSTKQTKYCRVHKRRYEWFLGEQDCALCRIVHLYPAFLRTMDIEKELRWSSLYDRGKEQVFKRSLLVKYLKDEQGWSFARIAKFLKRDYTTVKSLYSKKIH